MRIKDKLLFFLAIFLPALLSFRWLLFNHSLSWGDAPYFFKEGLSSLLAEPSAWTSRNINLGGVNLLLWLSPQMFLYGFLGKVLSNDNILRVLFYFPSIILSGFSTYLFTKYLKLSNFVRFFASLIYLLNTYYLLLIDGGQVGVALAYSIFPLALLSYRKLIDRPNYKNYFLSLILGLLLFSTDPRVGVISLISFIVWILIESVSSKNLNLLKNLKFFLAAMAGITLLSLYWIFPLLKISSSGLPSVSSLSLMTLINPLFLFQPHWPVNEFGKIANPPFYFGLIPILIFLGVALKPRKENLVFGLCFLVFAFLAKGNSAPLGGWYDSLLDKFPLAASLRDSSKFFIPLILFGGVLVGKSAEVLKKPWAMVAVYAYLLFAIFPVYTSGLNFVLSDRNHASDLGIISERISKTDGFFRVAWFPEKNPEAFHTDEKQALDAKDLVNLRPLNSLNVGSYDLFNYLHHPDFLSWYKFFGIKYLVLGENPRMRSLNEEETRNSQDLKARMATASGLVKREWLAETPVYEIPGNYPHLFTAERMLGVIGPDSGLPAIYFEDGKFDPATLQGISPDALSLVFNGKDLEDLRWSFLQKYFVNLSSAKNNDWAYFDSKEALEYRFQLLMRGLDLKDFDYGRGISFSTEAGEKIAVNLFAPTEGEYIFGIRSLGGVGRPLKLSIEDLNKEISKNGKTFSWYEEKVNLKKGRNILIIENPGGLKVANTVALVPLSEWESAGNLRETFLKYFNVLTTEEIIKLPKSNWGSLDFQRVSPVSYKITAPRKGFWVILTDSYHPDWKLRRGINYFVSYPIYSAVNGFYVDSRWTDLELVFWGQRYLRWGMYYSLVAFLIASIIFLWNFERIKNA